MKTSKGNRVKAFLCSLFLIVSVVVPPMPAKADYPLVTSGPRIISGVTPIVISPLTGQSSCNVEIVGSGSGVTQGLEQGAWVNVNSVQLPDSSSPSPTITGPGTFTANCASLQAFRFVPSSGSGTVTVLATGGVGRIIGAGVNGGRTNVVGTSPIQVTNAGNTATVSLATPLAMNFGGTGTSTIAAGCVSSDGTSLLGGPCPSPAPTSSPVSVVSGNSNVSVSTPSPGVFVVSAVTPSPAPTGNIIPGNGIGVSGTWPNVTVANNGTITLLAGNNVTLATSSPGVYTINAVTPSPAPAATPVFVTGTSADGVIVTTPSPGVFNVDLSGVPNTALAGPLVHSITAGSNVTLGGTATDPIVNTITPSPAPTLVAGNGIAIGSNVVSNTGVLNILSGNSNMAVATSSPGIYTLTVVTPSPAPTLTAGTGISIASNVVSNTGVLSVTASGNLSSSGGQNPAVTETNAPTWTGAATAASLTATGLTAGRCVQTNTGGLLSVTGAACASGSVTSVTGTSPVVSSGGNTPAISCPTCVTSVTAGSGNIVAGGTSTTPTIDLFSSPSVSGLFRSLNASSGTVSNFGLIIGAGGSSDIPHSIALINQDADNTSIGTLSTSTLNTVTGRCMSIGEYASTTLVNELFNMDCSGNVGILGTLHAGSVAGVVTSVSGSGNISSTGGTTPTVTITAAPTFNNVTLSGATASNCLGTNGSKVTTSSGEACPVSFQGGTRLGGLHIESGSQNIVTSAASCVSGTPITFQNTYNALPGYFATTQAIVGTTSTFATGSFSTTGVTPALCSVTNSGTTMTVFWMVIGF